MEEQYTGRVCALARMLCDKVEVAVNEVAPQDAATMRRLSETLRDLRLILCDLPPLEMEEQRLKVEALRAKLEGGSAVVVTLESGVKEFAE